MATIQGDQLRGHLDAMILAALEGRDGHGLEILRRLEAAGCGLLKLKEGSLYPALYRLEDAGLLKSVAEPQPAGQRGAPRRVYRITRKGTRSLQQGREEWRTFAAVVGGILGGNLCLNPSPAS